MVLLRRLRIVVSLFLLLLLAAVPPCSADLVPLDAPGVQFPQEMSSTWKEVRKAIRAEDWASIPSLIDRFDAQRKKYAYSGLHSISMELIDFAHNVLDKGNKEQAYLLSQYAQQLSPGAPSVILASIPIVREARGASSALVSVREMLSFFHRTPDVLILLTDVFLYPILFVFGLALFLSLGLCLSKDMVLIMRRMAAMLPLTIRGYLTPPLVAFLLMAPLLGGIYVALVCWSLITVFIVPRYRFFCLATGILLIGWATVIPLKENIHAWIVSDKIRVMRQVLAGSFEPGYESAFKELQAERPDDPLVPYAYALLLVQGNEYRRASELFDSLESERYLKPWILVQRGNMYMKQGKFQKADEMYDAAEAKGINTAEFFINRSRVKSKRMKTRESREYLKRAVSLDSMIVSESTDEEAATSVTQSEGIHVKPVYLPATYVFSSTLLPAITSIKPYDVRAQTIIPGVSMLHLCILGVALVCLSIFVRRQVSDHQVRLYFPRYKTPAIWKYLVLIIPGAGWFVSRHPIWGLVAVTLFLLCCAPLLPLPEHTLIVYGLVEDFFVPYISVLVGVAISLYVLSFPNDSQEDY